MIDDLEELFGGVEERATSDEEVELVPLPTEFDPSALFIDSSKTLDGDPKDDMTSMTRVNGADGDLSRHTPPPSRGDRHEEALGKSASEIYEEPRGVQGEGDAPTLHQILHHLAQTQGESEVDGATKEEVDTGERDMHLPSSRGLG